MDEQQYEEEYEEGYEEYVPQSNKWLWIPLILAVLAAIAFAALWFLRGGEIDRLTSDMRSAKAAADSNVQRLERDAENTRSQIDAGARKIAELENSLRDEQRRSAETAQQAERRLRDDAAAQAGRLQTVTAELEDARRRLAESEEKEKTASEGIAAGTAARQQLSAVQAQLATALAEGARTKRLEEELAKAKETISGLQGTIGDLEASKNNIGLELTTANEDLRKADQDRKELAAVKARLAGSLEELAKAKSEHAELSKNSGRINQLMETHGKEIGAAKTLETSLRAAIAGLESKYAEAQKALAARTDSPDGSAIDALRKRLDAAEKRALDAEEAAKKATEASKQAADARVRDLESRLAEAGTIADAAKKAVEEARKSSDSRIAILGVRLEEAGKANDAAKKAAEEAVKAADARAAALESRLAEAGGTIAKLEEKVGDLEAGHSSLRKELTSAGDDLRGAEAARDTLRKALDEAKKQAERAEKNLDDSREDAEKKFRERERELLDGFEKQKGDWQKQLDAIKQATEQAEPVPSPAVPVQAEPSPAQPAAAVQPAPVPAVAFEEPMHVIMGDPDRSVGRVAQVMQDGLTYVVNGGSNQRVRPGMVFDVHRRFGNMNRYVGLLRVTRPLDDFSLAVPAYPSREARVCPVTGRAVLDPSRNFSPYAESDEGRPVPLIAASSLGLGQDMPVVGDYIDNPFYDPNRRMVFSADGEMRDDSRAGALIEGLGGMQSESDAFSDFKLVRNVDPTLNQHARPQQVTVDSLGNYFDPAYAVYR